MNDSHEIAYMAGLFDGEGCIGAYVQKNIPLIYVQVEMGNAQGVELFHRWFGGSFRPQKRATARTISTWRWTVVNKNARVSLTTLLPFLIVKKDQAELALQWPWKQEGRRWVTPEERVARAVLVPQINGFNRKGRRPTTLLLP